MSLMTSLKVTTKLRDSMGVRRDRAITPAHRIPGPLLPTVPSAEHTRIKHALEEVQKANGSAQDVSDFYRDLIAYNITDEYIPVDSSDDESFTLNRADACLPMPPPPQLTVTRGHAAVVVFTADPGLANRFECELAAVTGGAAHTHIELLSPSLHKSAAPSI